ncbi:MAG: PIN domain-containing protein [Candidatus Limnocylindrales bacterium]
MAIDAYVIDAQPLVAFIKREAHWQRVSDAIAASAQGSFELRLTAVNAGEVIMAAERHLGSAAAHGALAGIQQWTDVIDVDLELGARAGWFKLRGGISYADCFAAALAHRDGLPLITGDPEFRRVEDVIRIAWLETLG